jgi:putative hydroxymethylpyrimidine transport system permease protein
MKRRGVGWLLPLGAALLLLGIWELYVDLGGVSSLILPAPHSVVSTLWNDRGTLGHDLLVSGSEIVLGILLATALALAISLVIHFSPVARRAIYPLVIGSQAIPIVIIAPILVIWLGFGLLPKLLVIALVCFFPIVVTTLAALEAVEPELLKLMRTFDATRLETFRRVELPSALPGVFTGAKLAAVFSVIGAVFAEQAGCNSGLGCLLQVTTSSYGEMPLALASVVVLCAFAIGLFTLLTVIERRTLPWVYRSEGSDRR